MIKTNLNISEAKTIINNLKNKRVAVTVNLGRNKKMTFNGVLEGVYPALFTVSPEEKNFLGKTSYSYSEYLCGNVKLKEVQ